MKYKVIFGLLFTVLVVVYKAFTVSGQTDIGVINADAVLRPSLASSVDLVSVISTVSIRVASEFSDALSLMSLTRPESALINALDQVSQRVGFDFAQGSIVTNLQFPKAIVNDTMPPEVVGDLSTQVSNGSAVLTWSTNEFTSMTFKYGTQPGNYTGVQSNTTFAKRHSVTLPNILSGSIIYFQITLTDLSNNASTTSERSVTITENRTVYLPLVNR